MASRIDLESLRLIVAIDRHHSLGAAARELGISQPAASARLRSVESGYGLSLVSRSTRGSNLTEDGQAVCSWAENVLREVDTLQAGVAALSEQRKGGLEIAASLTIAEYFLPRWLGEMQRTRPDVHTALRVMNSAEVEAQVRRRDVQLGFTESPERPRGLSTRRVGSDRLAVVVAARHEWARRVYAPTADELAQTPLVLREAGSGTRETFDRALGTEPRIALEASSTSALVGAAVNGVGPAVVSEVAVRSHLDAGVLVEVTTQLDLRRPLFAIWRADETLRSPATDLVAIAAQR
ncbi:LysR family transcriptional regulator [Solicola gregarius]|uniref:LysR family transcriptional regulator n=1 Tax=Solicola gregarius TaxID=2908642 RepID=A0AA46TLZ4_9ACTN|nr:LysR family transcriptional regulator [Solicola gregarius]UYM06863.1 LysR family transcriptional regulator [Solicola gregarius]